MLFVAQGRVKDSSHPTERITQRLEWDYPETTQMVGEYWLGSTLIAIFETDSHEDILTMQRYWEPHIQFTVSPAITAEAGMSAARAMMQAAATA